MSESIAVCVATFRRPAELATLLGALSAQDYAGTHHVYVVDNDPEGSAESIVRMHAPTAEYICEPAPGIVAARNAALAVATEPLLAFIDDDEYPDPAWLTTLAGAMESYSSEVVWGPVVSVFPDETPEWVRSGGFFSRARHATGTEFDQAATNNTLVRRAAVMRLEQPFFDERFSASGGSDTEFFRRLWKEGARIIWCDEALVYEKVPTSRMSLDWLRRRARRTGNVRGRLLVDDGRRGRAWIEGIGRLALGGGRLLLDRVRRAPVNSRSLNTWMRGWGTLDAARDRVVIEYRR